MIIQQKYGTVDSGSTPTYTNATQGTVPVGSSQQDITIDLAKNYLLFWNLKSTDTSYVYNGMWKIDTGTLTPIIVVESAYPTVSISGTTLTIKNAGSSTRGEYILVEVE